MFEIWNEGWAFVLMFVASFVVLILFVFLGFAAEDLNKRRRGNRYIN